MKIERLPGEEFKIIPDTENFYVSNLGRVMYIEENKNGESEEILSNQILSRNKTGKYYNDVYIHFSGKRKSDRVRVNRIVAAVWKDPTFKIFYKDDKRIADHIDGNSQNNRADNIRVISQSENILSAIYDLGKNVSKPTKRCYARKGDDYREYDSTNMLVRDISNCKNAGVFNHAIKYNHKINGYTVGYLDV